MVNTRLMMSVVTATASLFLMPVIRWVDGSPLQKLSSPALASFAEQPAYKFNYVPPYRGTPRRTQGAGTRGGDESGEVTLKLLVPDDHTGQTLSGHPTFFWYVSEIPEEPVEFALVESGVAQPIFVQQLQLEKAGIIRLKMPKNLPALVPGKEYRWSVSLVSNANRRSSDTVAQSWIKRVAETPALKQQLATAKSDRDRASIYAEAGLWYDAINILLKAQSTNSTDRSIHEAFLSLLDRAGLTEVAEQE
ncbi:DUF928 domain-containing protein [Allocoleopsis franciscana]|uniref:DUF928 domain-containing protein n=1 Tax=Allocoleopsis franciscana PCC 7113 TaxID=1173027 RepID=K9WFT0_9CYAN|nr:DUF928 domain-containing protein [Allocoleopsis franciscana]AFZ18392.1 protein of unknown function (DUF928) [Allocoleopsis franciscana PCC 7113]